MIILSSLIKKMSYECYIFDLKKIQTKSWNFSLDPDPLFHKTDLRIRIRIQIKVKWIHNIAFFIFKPLLHHTKLISYYCFYKKQICLVASFSSFKPLHHRNKLLLWVEKGGHWTYYVHTLQPIIISKQKVFILENAVTSWHSCS